MILALVFVAQIVSSSPPLSPAEAAAVLARLESPSNFATRFVCTDCDGPRVVVADGAATDGPFGAFTAYGLYRFAPIHRGAWSRIGRYPSTALRISAPVLKPKCAPSCAASHLAPTAQTYAPSIVGTQNINLLTPKSRGIFPLGSWQTDRDHFSGRSWRSSGRYPSGEVRK
jgi:hypothetical protein